MKPRYRRSPFPWNRLLTVFLILGVGSLFLGCLPSQDRRAIVLTDTFPPLSFGVFPFLEAGKLMKALSPLTVYLSRGLNRRLEILLVSDYADLEKLVSQQRVDIGWFTPRSRASANGARMISLCRPRPVGGDYYRGVIIVRKNSGIASLTDLRQKRFAYVDRNSKSGFIYPNELFTRQGLNPLSFFRSVDFAGTYDRCVSGVIAGEYDAAAVSEMVFRGQDAGTDLMANIDVIATTSAILADPIFVNESLEPELREKIRDLLLHPEKFPQGREAMEALAHSTGISGFGPDVGN